MGPNEPSWTIGIEEEYLLVDKATGDVVTDPPSNLFTDCQKACREGQVSPEFLRSQIEIGTRVCTDIHDARRELASMRGLVARVAGASGLAPLAASTHPFANWVAQKHTAHARYDQIAEDMQEVAHRLLICGMHVHVGIEDDELRIDLMNQLSYFLPHLLALSTSSPFWEGRRTGLKSYRLTVFAGFPRTGLPQHFASYAEFQRQVDILVATGLIEEGTRIWWDLRPSARYPTLEMRIADVCTRLDDAICIAALTLCLLRMLFRLRRQNQRWRFYPGTLIAENRWLAMRYGIEKGLVDFGRSEILPMSDLLDEMLELIREDAEQLGCTDQVEHAREILRRGTSADRQLELYRKLRSDGAEAPEALREVVRMLIEETVIGT